MPSILVTGGAGYIGSNMVRALLNQGYTVVVLDDLSSGHRDMVMGGTFIEGSISAGQLLDELFGSHNIDAVVHFAGFIEVGRSVTDPLAFYINNVAGTLSLLAAMRRNYVSRIIFSSTAAVYGNPNAIPIMESSPIIPVNPYGHSKAQIEQVLRDLDAADGLRSVCLRYFNASGADPHGDLGERHDPETHLIPLALAAMAGRRPPLKLFGDDYPTPDGTCVRDYVHVCDLVEAHVVALRYLLGGGQSLTLNVGGGIGHSVQEVLRTVERVCGAPVPVEMAPRRAGDPPALIAAIGAIEATLEWRPSRSDIGMIIEDAWRFHSDRWK